MVIKFTKNFRKQYDKLPVKTRDHVDQRIKVFAKNPFDLVLYNHALYGKYRGYRSINITGDVRALYYQQGNTIYIFAFVGSHSQLYG